MRNAIFDQIYECRIVLYTMSKICIAIECMIFSEHYGYGV